MSSSKISPLSSLSSLRERSSPVSPLPFPVSYTHLTLPTICSV